jgi:SAM-dependent methyltransferase
MAAKRKLCIADKADMRTCDPTTGLPFGVRHAVRFTKRRLSLSNPKVLDFGCGDGNLVLRLIRAGIDAYGVDVDQKRILAAKRTLSAIGEAERIFSTESCATVFHSFNLILSDQVVEHVSDLDASAQLISELSARRAITVHIYPTRLRIIEPHLLMPGVHWFPEGPLRLSVLKLFCALNLGPTWPELSELSRIDQAQHFERYLATRVFYRGTGAVITAMNKAGWKSCETAEYRPILPPSLRSRSIWHLLLRSQVSTFEKAEQ